MSMVRVQCGCHEEKLIRRRQTAMHRSPEFLHESPEPVVRAIGRYAAPHGRDFPWHQHSCYELVYYVSGAPLCRMEGDERMAQPGLLWLTPPTVHHEEIARTAYSNFYLHLDYPAGSLEPTWILDNERQSYGRLFAEIHSEKQKRQRANAALTRLLTTELITRIRAEGEESVPCSRPERLVQRFEDYLVGAKSEALSVKALARGCGVSESTLRAAYREVRHGTPREALRAERLRRATHWLRHSDLTLEVIAELAGFDSASHLSREFRRMYEVSPGVWRRELCGAG